jgi:hypothetical protein
MRRFLHGSAARRASFRAWSSTASRERRSAFEGACCACPRPFEKTSPVARSSIRRAGSLRSRSRSTRRQGWLSQSRSARSALWWPPGHWRRSSHPDLRPDRHLAAEVLRPSSASASPASRRSPRRRTAPSPRTGRAARPPQYRHVCLLVALQTRPSRCRGESRETCARASFVLGRELDRPAATIIVVGCSAHGRAHPRPAGAATTATSSRARLRSGLVPLGARPTKTIDAV